MSSFVSSRFWIAAGLLVSLPLVDARLASSQERSRNFQPSAMSSSGAAMNSLGDAARDAANAAISDESRGDEPGEIGHDGQPLDATLSQLGVKVRRTLAIYEPKHLNARDNSCWEVMHGLIAFGPRTEIFRDGPGGTTVNAMGWLCWGGRCQNAPLIVLEGNHPHALYGVGLEGHDAQYLAMLAQWRVRPESPMHIGGKDFVVGDLIEEEKATCQSGTELTFKLISLAHYLPSDAEWTSRYGEKWNIPKLIKAEIESPINGATCGGSHRLLGISNAVKERAKRGEPIDGQWARAAKYVSDYQRYTLGTLQNPDGSFSTEWFKFPEDRPGDIDRKVQTTGHMLEFIVWSLPSDELRDPRVTKAVDFLSNTLAANPDHAWSVGPLGHALHALMIYHERMYNEPALPADSVAPAEPLNIKKGSISAISPPEPECETRDNLSISQLQRAAEAPKHATEVAVSAPKTATAKELADQSDGCTDAIPTKAPQESELKVALRDDVSAKVSHPAAPSVPQSPTDAPFDRPGTTTVGP